MCEGCIYLQDGIVIDGQVFKYCTSPFSDKCGCYVAFDNNSYCEHNSKFF